MSKFTPIHQESVTYKNRNDFDKDLSVAYPMCMSRSAVMTEMRVVGDHLVAEWNHINHEGKIYVLDELSNEKLGAYHKAAMHDTLAGKKNRTAGMSKAVIRLAGAHKPLIKEGEDLVKPQAVPATDGKAQELSEGETRRFVAWSKDPAKAVGFVGGDEEAVRKAAAAHFKASAFGVDVLDAALKTQLKQNGVPEKLWVASKDDVVLSEGKVGDVVYGAWRVGHQVQSRREKVSGKITGAARGPASGTKWVTVDDGAKTHTLPAAELTPAKGYGWPDDDGEQPMVESTAADELLAVLGEAKNPKSLSHADLVSVLKDSDIPVKAVESAYAGCDADICHYFAVVESGDLFGVVGIRIMSMDGDISVLSFDTEASDVSEDKEAAMEAMVKAASKPIAESKSIRADSELLEAIDTSLEEAMNSFEKSFAEFMATPGESGVKIDSKGKRTFAKHGIDAFRTEYRDSVIVSVVSFDSTMHPSLSKAEDALISSAKDAGLTAARSFASIVIAKDALALKKRLAEEVKMKELVEALRAKGIFDIPPFPENVKSYAMFPFTLPPDAIALKDENLKKLDPVKAGFSGPTSYIMLKDAETGEAAIEYLKKKGFSVKSKTSSIGRVTVDIGISR